MVLTWLIFNGLINIYCSLYHCKVFCAQYTYRMPRGIDNVKVLVGTTIWIEKQLIIIYTV